MLLQFSKKDAGTYEVILKDDRGKDTSELKLKDTGQSLFLPHRSRQQWHVALFLLHTRSSRQENRAFGPSAGRRQHVAPGVCVAAGEYGDNAQPGGNRAGQGSAWLQIREEITLKDFAVYYIHSLGPFSITVFLNSTHVPQQVEKHTHTHPR